MLSSQTESRTHEEWVGGGGGGGVRSNNEKRAKVWTKALELLEI